MDLEKKERKFSVIETITGPGNVQNQNMGSSNRHKADSNSHITRRPIVFTTRLDDMNVFDGIIKHIHPELLTKTIIEESKPKFTPDLLCLTEPYKNKLMSFIQLKYKIKDFNVVQEVRCKYKSLSKNNSNQQEENILILSDDDCQTLHTDKKVKQNELKNVYVIINDIETNTTDIYYLNSRGRVMQIWKTASKNEEILHLSDKYAVHIRLNPCCWYKREEDIKLLKNTFSHSAIRFFKNSHKCALDKCICCCGKNRNNIIKKPSSDVVVLKDITEDDYSIRNKVNINDSNESLTSEVQEKDKKEETDNAAQQSNGIHRESITPLISSNISADYWIRKMLTKAFAGPPVPTSLIKKALKYNPCLLPEKLVKTNNSNNNNYLKCARIQIKDASNLGCEVYVIGSTGEIQEHFNTNYVLSKKQQIDKLEINKRVCCWYKRNAFMKLLRAKNISPTALKFIKTPHTCPNGKCNCCCRPIVKPAIENVTFNNVILPERPIHTSDFVNKITCLKITFGRYLPSNKDCDLSVEKNTTKSESTNQIQITENVTSEVVDVCDPKVLSPAIAYNPTPDTITTVSTNTNNNVENTVTDKLDYAQVEILVNSILDRFRDVRLNINPDGKIAAELNTPSNSLSAIELKVLGSILTCAQKQVDSLRLTPGTKLNFGLDSSTPADANASTLSSTVANNLTKSAKDQMEAVNPKANFFDIIDLTDGESPVKQSCLCSSSKSNSNVYKDFVTMASQKRVHYLEAFKHFIKRKSNRSTNVNIGIPHKVGVVPLSDKISTTDVNRTTWAKKRKTHENKINMTETESKKVKISSTITDPLSTRDDENFQQNLIMQQQSNSSSSPANSQLLFIVPDNAYQGTSKHSVNMLDPLISEVTSKQINEPLILENQFVSSIDPLYTSSEHSSATSQNMYTEMDSGNDQYQNEFILS